MKFTITILFAILICFSPNILAQVPINTLVQISRAEDSLRYDKTIEDLIKSANVPIRKRAALAAGRIGDERAVPVLTGLLEKDSDPQIRAMAAFALGEIESIKAADAILKVLQNNKETDEVRARAVEAAGKIVAANIEDDSSKNLGKAILDALTFEDGRGKQQNRDVILLGITAVLRSKPAGGDVLTAKFLKNADARIRADAANTLSRIRALNANEQLRTMLAADNDAIARANAARALGAAVDPAAFDVLLKAAIADEDSRVRVSAIRSLGSLKDKRAADRLLERGDKLFAEYQKSKFANPSEKTELLEIAATLGRVLPNTNDEKAVKFLETLRKADKFTSPETEIALARIAPIKYVGAGNLNNGAAADWRQLSAQAQAVGELANSDFLDKAAKDALQSAWQSALMSEKQIAPDIVIPDYLRTFAQFKSENLADILRKSLLHKDVFIRATAAELLGEPPAAKENVEALKTAFAASLKTDVQYNDAQLAALEALYKLDKNESVSTLLTALNAPDYLVRKKAFDLLQNKDAPKDSSVTAANLRYYAANNKNQILPYSSASGTKLGQNFSSNADYIRAVSRQNGKFRAIFTTEKGVFTIDLLPENAPLTVDNFINLAKSNYFDGLTVHRVVANFVMQDGDPRGDGNGGPGWEIRDEINMILYERGSVGMALSGRNTGGSQWFVTHSPQPHLDSGYTVFGKVNETDMKIVDTIVRGDKILSVKIEEGKILPQNIKKPKTNRKKRS